MSAAPSGSELFRCAEESLASQPDSFHEIRLLSSEYRPDNKNGLKDEFTVAVIGGFLVDRMVDYGALIKTGHAVRYGMDPDDLGVHVNNAVFEVKTYLGDNRDMITEAMIDADVYKLLWDSSDETRFVSGIQTMYKPKTNQLRSVFAYDRNFDDTAFALRSRVTERAIEEDLEELSPIHMMAEKECEKKNAILAKAAAAAVLPCTDLKILGEVVYN